MRIRYTPRARNDLDEIFQYINPRNPRGAANVLRAIDASVELLAKNARASVRSDDPDIRVKTVSRYPYRIFYRIEGEAVAIVHIRHASRRPR
jgi:toxin ParE1/3/4